jgi:hypothetical protein
VPSEPLTDTLPEPLDVSGFLQVQNQELVPPASGAAGDGVVEERPII